MKRQLGIAVAVIALLATAALTYSKQSAKAASAERELDQARLQKDYLERSSWIRQNPDATAYASEVKSLFRWYFERVDEHVKKYGGSPELDEFLAEVTPKSKQSEKGAADHKKARYELAKKFFDRMQSGKYAPLFTGADQNMRLDILDADPRMVNGRPVVRFELALWGAPRQMKQDQNGKRMATSAAFDVQFKLAQAKGKDAFEMSIAGDPSLRIDFPERYIWAFPPQMLLGYYDVPLLPAEISKGEITFRVSSQPQAGQPVTATYLWKLDIPDEWKLSPGEKWEGAEEIVNAEEATSRDSVPTRGVDR